MKRMIFLILRLFIAAIFITTAIGKLLDNRGFSVVLETYQLFPSSILLPLGLAVSLFELVLGWLLVTGQRLRLAALGALISYIGYLAIAVITNLRGLALTNCGCFGVFLARPMTWWTVLEDTILVAVCFVFWRMSSSHR